MRRYVYLLVLMAVAMVIAVVGCSDTTEQKSDPSSRKGNVASKQDDQKPKTVVVEEKPKTVMVNEGLSAKEEEELNERLGELEKKVNSQEEQGSRDAASRPAEIGQPEQPQSAQAEVRSAAEAYYQAVEAEDWGYTYDNLDSETQSAFTRDEWFAKNQAGADASPAAFTVQYVEMDGSSPTMLANVTVLVTGEDGSSSVRDTYFVYEDGSWKHRFSPEEYEIFASAPTGTSSASPSASASASATASSSPSASPNASPNRNDNASDRGSRGNGSSRPAPAAGGDIDCDQVNGPIRVPPADPNNLDGDGNGFGCEE